MRFPVKDGRSCLYRFAPFGSVGARSHAANYGHSIFLERTGKAGNGGLPLADAAQDGF